MIRGIGKMRNASETHGTKLATEYVYVVDALTTSSIAGDAGVVDEMETSRSLSTFCKGGCSGNGV